MTARNVVSYQLIENRFEAFAAVEHLNALLFEENRLINRPDHDLILAVVAESEGETVGFKLGYSLNQTEFYSAKGGVLPQWRRAGLARTMLYLMMEAAGRRGFTRFVYDTFPNLYRPMLILGLKEGFSVEHVQWNAQYNDWQMRLGKSLGTGSAS